MITLRLLNLNQQGLSAHVRRRGKLIREDSFPATPAGLAGFTAYLQGHSSSRFRLLADMPEESYRLETIPYLRGKDRDTLIHRRLAQHFPGTSLTTAISLGHEKSRRKNERILLAALTNDHLLSPWLAAMAATGTALAGLYTVAQLAGPLLKRLGLAAQPCLLITMQGQNLRQSLVVDGQAVFSRSAPLPAGPSSNLADHVAAEARKLHLYLLGQRLIDGDQNLPAYIQPPSPALEPLLAASPNSGSLAFRFLDCHRAARESGLPGTPGQDAELRFLQLLAEAPPRQQFLPAAERRRDRQLLIRHALFSAGALALALSLFLGGTELYLGRQHQLAAADLRAWTSQWQQHQDRIAGNHWQPDVGREAINQVLPHLAHLEKFQGRLEDAYRLVSQALDQSSAVELERLEWTLGTISLPPSAPATDSLLVKGSIRLPGESSPRQALAAFDQFVRSLESQPGIIVAVSQRPFDMDSGHTIEGSSRDDPARRAGVFTLLLKRSLQP